MEEYIYKPTRGRCSRCGSTNLVFYDEGNGKCATCSYEFVWKKCTHCGSNNVEYHQSGELECRICGARQIFLICPRCQSREITFALNGLAVCKSCGHEVYWSRVKREQTPEKSPAEAIEIVPAVYTKDAKAHFAINLKNNSKYRLEDIVVNVIVNKDKILPEVESKHIKYIEPEEHGHLVFTLEPLKEFRNETVKAKITLKLKKGEKFETETIETRPMLMSVEFTALYPREVIEEHWRVSVHTMKKLEKEFHGLKFKGETLHRLVCDVIRDKNMYAIPSAPVHDARFFRELTKFFAHDYWDNLYACYVETIEESGESRLVLKFYASNEDLLLPFYASIISEINDKTRLRAKPPEEPAHPQTSEIAEPEPEVKQKKPIVQSQIELPLEKGYSYLIFESKTEKTFEIFREMLKDSPGLCITTTYPDKVREEYGLNSATIYWLSDTETTAVPVVKPSRMEFEIMRAITTFIKNNKNAVLLIDGFENLVLGNNFLDALKFMKRVNDVAAMHHATILVPISPKAFDEKDMYTLRKEFDKTRTV
ncbi:MAG: DUF835 domain-containing protein [Thermoplasmata archaeon]